MDFKSLPKIELHLHLDCSLSAAVVARMQPSVTPSDFETEFIAPQKCVDLADYLTRAEKGVALMQTEEALTLVVADLFDQLREDNVLYAEIRFAPLLHTRKDLRPENAVDIIDTCVAKESLRTGIDARLILCTLRHFTQEQSMATAILAERFLDRTVTALDIAGDEAGHPIDAHIPAFQYAAKNRIHRTAHAGEARGAESIWETLKHFLPTRIGHGVRCVEDSRLLNHLQENKIHLEVCPTSNVQTNVVATYEDHHVDALFRAGISLSINTDARTISNVTLTGEYEHLHQKFGWGPEHFQQCNLNAIEAAFIPDSLKNSIRLRLLHEFTVVAS